MKIEFKVPDGEFCEDCTQQTEFVVEEFAVTTSVYEMTYCIRSVVAKCSLFNQKLHGGDTIKMKKCVGCLNAGIKDNSECGEDVKDVSRNYTKAEI